MLFLLLVTPLCAQPLDVKPLTEWLTPRMEAELSRRERMREVAFSLSAKRIPGGVELTVPDYIERMTVFRVNLEGGRLSGRVFTKEERALVEQAARASLGPSVVVSNQIQVFPYPRQPPYAVFAPPLSNLGAKASEASEKNLATQARMGELAWVLEKTPKFTRVRMDSDGYIAWARTADLRMLDAAQFQALKAAPRAVLQADAPPLFMGTKLPRRGDALQGPNGREYPVAPEVLTRKPDLVATAHEFLPGAPHAVKTYLWGGSVGRELDCSGYLQTVYRVCGTQLPRDADQQQAFSVPVAATLDKISELQPGDLVFFSEKREYADHIGMYIGENRFIHCSSSGPYPGVKVNTLVGGADYDKKLQGMYYGAGRPPR